jgi:hypothetical protein
LIEIVTVDVAIVVVITVGSWRRKIHVVARQQDNLPRAVEIALGAACRWSSWKIIELRKPFRIAVKYILSFPPECNVAGIAKIAAAG